MTKANLNAFFEYISNSEELQDAIGDEIDAEKLIKLGEEKGFVFTRDELRQAADSFEESCSGELSDTQLQEVAGGGANVRGKGSFALNYAIARKGVNQQLGSRSPRRKGMGVVVNVGGSWYEEPENA